MNTNTIKPVRKAVFPVAGLGTRFLPATKVMPKEMLTVGDRPLIQHVVEEARNAGIEEFIFVSSPHKGILEEHFGTQPDLEKTLAARQKNDLLALVTQSHLPEGSLAVTHQPQPLGLGHAVWCARKLVGDEPFAVLLPDDIIQNKKGCMSQMIDLYNQKGGNVIAVKDVPQSETNKYGIVDIESESGKAVKVKGLIEKPDPAKAPSTLCIIGRYILQPEIFTLLAAFEKGAGGEIQLTDAMAKLVGKHAFHGLRFDGTHFDCGGRLGFIEANLAFGLSDASLGSDIKNILKKYT